MEKEPIKLTYQAIDPVYETPVKKSLIFPDWEKARDFCQNKMNGTGNYISHRTFRKMKLMQFQNKYQHLILLAKKFQKNSDFPVHCSEVGIELINLAREELQYSPKTVNSDILTSVLNLYE